MTTTQTSFASNLSKALHWVEKILLLSLAIGATLAYLEINSGVLIISLIGLAIIFFLYAFMLVEIVREEGEQLGFSDLLAASILPKVMWIASAVSSGGLALFLMSTGNDGYKQMLMIGGLTIGIALVLVTLFLVSGVKNIKVVAPILLRAVPLFLMDFYTLFG